MVINGLTKVLLRIRAKDFVSGWKDYLRAKIKKPKTLFALIFAIRAMDKRWRRDENRLEKLLKAEIRREESQAKGPAVALANQIDKRTDDEKRDTWWKGLGLKKRVVWYWKYKVEYPKMTKITDTIVKPWAWEQEKAK